MYTLRGKGVKQHCQDIKLALLHGSASMLSEIFEGEITIQGLEVMILPEIAATLS